MGIGNLDLENRLFLAPMAEITDSPFRRIARERGAGLVFTQMVSALGLVEGDFNTLRYLVFDRAEKPIGVQILGNDPSIIGEAVNEISRYKPDLIDLNCGCPVDKVTSCNMGAALLNDPKRIGKIVDSMAKNSNGIPISVKIRLGYDDRNIEILDIVRAVENNGASFITVHARTKKQRYDSEANWEWIRKIMEFTKLKVIGNGSLFTPQDVKKMIETTGCYSAMIARGALGNPFIFERFNKLSAEGFDPGHPDVDTTAEVLKKHLKLLEYEYGPVNALDKGKKQLLWYFRFFPELESLLKNVFGILAYSDLYEIVDEHALLIKKANIENFTNTEIDFRFRKKVLYWLETDEFEALM
ncbi:tRNA-U20-dihydrouridine synthase [Melioribacter roseus P3M-2]|uniref:tRNA-dihydrouridine synthase n=1 Tax=Melioribacter roseus (strain DSM 23840 / JCM 17771 / VKM B-2668 / P3M-2) TaxID=1191523 RepID=I7A184_MELRP|nr:tRNA dihydrouridine synthase DusB [Melioribacter roseus]AFN74958.1 tRNA-U20-dihydrouridine synthase [Melioribacter roseus P3M-2]